MQHLLNRKTTFTMLIIALLLTQLLTITANAEIQAVQWSYSEQQTLSNIKPLKLAPGKELKDGGYNLYTMELTTDPDMMDIAFSQAGEIGGFALVKVNEELEEPTDTTNLNYQTLYKMNVGDVYVVILSDGSLAKLQIDRFTKSSVTFTYVLEEFIEDESEYVDEGEIPAYEFEEGNVDIIWEAYDDSVAWDVYRSEDNENYVLLNDFHLDVLTFVDKYAEAGTSYYYKIAGYDEYGNQLYLSDPMMAIVLPKQYVGLEISLEIGSKIATVNGEEMSLTTPPVIIDNVTMVPLRFIAEAMGAEVVPSEKNKVTITTKDQVIELWVDKVTANINGKQVKMVVPAKRRDGSTLVPLRFVSESLGMVVTPLDKKRILITQSEG